MEPQKLGCADGRARTDGRIDRRSPADSTDRAYALRRVVIYETNHANKVLKEVENLQIEDPNYSLTKQSTCIILEQYPTRATVIK